MIDQTAFYVLPFQRICHSFNRQLQKSDHFAFSFVSEVQRVLHWIFQSPFANGHPIQVGKLTLSALSEEEEEEEGASHDEDERLREIVWPDVSHPREAFCLLCPLNKTLRDLQIISNSSEP